MTAIKVGSKYYPLFEHLMIVNTAAIELSFDEIEAILTSNLPSSAFSGKAFWSNRGKGALQALAWLGAGFHTTEVDLERRVVKFEKPEFPYEVRVEGDTVLWDGNMVRALRAHLDLSQGALAEHIGVRQQTVSEWETGIYSPTRSRSKHLSMIAEQSGFEIASREDRGY